MKSGHLFHTTTKKYNSKKPDPVLGKLDRLHQPLQCADEQKQDFDELVTLQKKKKLSKPHPSSIAKDLVCLA